MRATRTDMRVPGTFLFLSRLHPEQITGMSKSGELISAVAVTGDKAFLGHAALLYPKAGRS